MPIYDCLSLLTNPTPLSTYCNFHRGGSCVCTITLTRVFTLPFPFGATYLSYPVTDHAMIGQETSG